MTESGQKEQSQEAVDRLLAILERNKEKVLVKGLTEEKLAELLKEA